MIQLKETLTVFFFKASTFRKAFARIAVIFSAILVVGCASDGNDLNDKVTVTTIEKNFTIVEGASLTFNLGSGYPTEGGIAISSQAKNFQFSEITFTPTVGVLYEYLPKDGFIGKDYVEITRTSTIGDNRTIEKTVYKISIEVTSE